jgi:fermentation-respiration switch protein FrsA (DUF1100 family)
MADAIAPPTIPKQMPATMEPPVPPPHVAPRWKRYLKRIVKLGLCVYLGLAIVLFFLQNWMIFPGASTQGTREAIVKPAPDQTLARVPTRNGQTIAVLFAPALLPDGSPHPDAAHRPTILYFYGNAMTISSCFDELHHFRRLGANVAIAELVGYGLSTGKPSEQNTYATADTAYDYLLTRSDVDPHQIIPTGWSLGAAAAIDLAARKPVAGLATFSAFTSMPDMAHKLLPWFPTSLLLRHRFQNERKIAAIDVPIFLAHGTRDDLVPYPMHARLAKAAKGPVTLVPVEGAEHNDLFQIGGPKLMRQFGEFIEKVHQNCLAAGPKARSQQ